MYKNQNSICYGVARLFYTRTAVGNNVNRRFVAKYVMIYLLFFFFFLFNMYLRTRIVYFITIQSDEDLSEALVISNTL